MRILLLGALLFTNYSWANCRYWGQCLDGKLECHRSSTSFDSVNVYAGEKLTALAKDIFICTSPYGAIYEQMYPGQIEEILVGQIDHGQMSTPRSIRDIDPALVNKVQALARQSCLKKKRTLEAKLVNCP